MNEDIDEITVEQTRIFKKAFDRLTEDQKDLVDKEIGEIIKNPEIGTRKKGDLQHLWVHKFRLTNQEVLLGYSWVESKFTLYLLNLGSHENFYRDAKSRRQADLNFIK